MPLYTPAVTLTGDQTAAGIKTFTSAVVLSGGATINLVTIDNANPKVSFYVTGVTERAYIQYSPATPALRIDSDENIQLAPANITALTLDAAGRLLFGTAVDTNLYRSAADTLKTDDAFAIGGDVGFYGTTPVAKPAVTGSRGGNAALASLLTALASQGLLTDSSSA